MPAGRLDLLYIDDDAVLGRLVQRFCGRLGWSVELASDADRGLDMARSRPFDAIALDHYMPGRDGLSVLPDLLAISDAPPVIYVTAAEEARIAVTAMKAGAADYVVKDVGGDFLKLLTGAIRQAIAGRTLVRDKELAERAARESHARLELLAQQQALLLREMNHRIANSLQLITSLLEMHARKSGDETVRAALRQASERVEAVAKVHRRLYNSSDVSAVEMDDYLRGLLGELDRVADDGGGTRVQLLAEPVRLPTDKAVSVGLIVSELVTNAVKYAYPGEGAGGPIRVDFRREPACWMLSVEDDGVGFDETAKPRGTGLGSVIVSAMARNLRADVVHCSDRQGTRVEVRVPA